MSNFVLKEKHMDAVGRKIITVILVCLLFTAGVSIMAKDVAKKPGKYAPVVDRLKDLYDSDENFAKLVDNALKSAVVPPDGWPYDPLNPRKLFIWSEKCVLLCLAPKTKNSKAGKKSPGKLLVFLCRHYGERAVILIDEYDAPVHAGFNHGYYDEVINFIRNFLCGGLKNTDQYLEKIVLWDLEGNLLADFNEHIGTVNAAIFSADGKRILIASADGTAKPWYTPEAISVIKKTNNQLVLIRVIRGLIFSYRSLTEIAA